MFRSGNDLPPSRVPRIGGYTQDVTDFHTSHATDSSERKCGGALQPPAADAGDQGETPAETPAERTTEVAVVARGGQSQLLEMRRVLHLKDIPSRLICPPGDNPNH